MGWHQKIPFLLLIAFVVVLADQASKFWAVGELTRAFDVESAESFDEKLRAYRVMKYLEPLRRSPITVVEGFWRFRYLENPGAAWGVLGSLDPSFRLPFFRSAPLVAMAILALLYFRAAKRQWLLRLSLAVIVGGAMGNFVDRWLHGYVIDFIDWQIWGYHWPTFNVADVAISLGVVGVAGESLRSTLRRRRRTRISEEKASIASPTPSEGESEPFVSEWPAESGEEEADLSASERLRSD